jgi:hypothetical protein
MTDPFSQEPVERALFEALLLRRRSLLGTGDPIHARRLLADIDTLSKAADLLLGNSAADAMNVECDSILSSGRVVNASAKLKPLFLSDGAKAGVSAPPNPKSPSAGWRTGRVADAQALIHGADLTKEAVGEALPDIDGWKAGTSVDGGGAGTSASPNAKSSADGGWTGTLSLKEADTQAPFRIDGGGAGPFIVRPVAEGQALAPCAMPSVPPTADTQAPFKFQKWADTQAPPTFEEWAEGRGIGVFDEEAGKRARLYEEQLQGWSPTDDVAVKQASPPKLNGRLIGRHLFYKKPKG